MRVRAPCAAVALIVGCLSAPARAELAPDPPAEAPAPAPDARAPDPAPEPAVRDPDSAPAAARPGPGAGMAAVGVALVETWTIGLSVWAGYEPQAAGWTELLLSPLACAGDGTTRGLCAVGIAGYAGIGLANVLVLSRDSWSRSERVLANVAAWHAWFGALALADWAGGRSRRGARVTAPRVALAVVPADVPRIVLNGTF